MSEVDYIIRDLKISQRAQFNMIEFYKTIKSWFEINRYDFYERDYQEVQKGKKKNVKITWIGEKEINDYSKLVIKVNIKLDNYEIIENTKEKLVDGKLSISFESLVESDYEKKWEISPIWQFIRSVSDKYFTEKKRKMFEKELHNDTYDICTKVKTFLNLYKFS
ncbi:MAG: hypothetical protein ABIH25_01065 [Candidatus Woesearchaeota archaeon]